MKRMSARAMTGRRPMTSERTPAMRPPRRAPSVVAEVMSSWRINLVSQGQNDNATTEDSFCKGEKGLGSRSSLAGDRSASSRLEVVPRSHDRSSDTDLTGMVREQLYRASSTDYVPTRSAGQSSNEEPYCPRPDAQRQHEVQKLNTPSVPSRALLAQDHH